MEVHFATKELEDKEEETEEDVAVGVHVDRRPAGLLITSVDARSRGNSLVRVKQSHPEVQGREGTIFVCPPHPSLLSQKTSRRVYLQGQECRRPFTDDDPQF